MLTELHLRNYRCFREHKLSFKDLTIVVGGNNAGKSTVVEALRLVAMVTGLTCPPSRQQSFLD
ncbi:MAG: AAA family ATPase [Myxococcota bacterium]